MRAPYGERAVIISVDGETNTTADSLYEALEEKIEVLRQALSLIPDQIL